MNDIEIAVLIMAAIIASMFGIAALLDMYKRWRGHDRYPDVPRWFKRKD